MGDEVRNGSVRRASDDVLPVTLRISAWSMARGSAMSENMAAASGSDGAP